MDGLWRVVDGLARRTQERGRTRRAALVEASRKLLRAREIDEISLTDIAEEAGIPKSSAYHFFSQVLEVFEAAAGDIEGELQAWLEQLSTEGCTDWRQVVTRFTGRGAAFFNGNRDAMQLLIGPKSPAAIKLKDRQNDFAIGAQLKDKIAAHFQLPELADTPEIFFRGIEIADLFFGLSVIRHGHITDDFDREAGRATCAYLSLYLPVVLPRATA
jgi:AcrR family transcriptional regulator